MKFSSRNGRAQAIAVRRGWDKSLCLRNSGDCSLEKKGNSVLNFGSLKALWIAMGQVLSPLIQARLKISRENGMKRSSVRARGHFCALFAVQNDPPNVFQPSSPYITPHLVAEMSKFHLRELLGLGSPNFLSEEDNRATNVQSCLVFTFYSLLFLFRLFELKQ